MPHGIFHGLRHVAPVVRVVNPSSTPFVFKYSTMPITGDVIAESRAEVDANGTTTWSRTSVFPQDDVIVVPATSVV
jgi:hypothetical protein